jgi:hypothetical protein
MPVFETGAFDHSAISPFGREVPALLPINIEDIGVLSENSKSGTIWPYVKLTHFRLPRKYAIFLAKALPYRPYRLMVRTPAFQAVNRSSILRRVTENLSASACEAY